MALATFSRGTKAKLDATKKTDGRIYVTTDTGNMYVDVGNETDSSAQRFLIGADGIKAASDAVASAKSYTDTVAAGKANTAHTHEMADVTGLSDALAGKADATHTHAIADVDGLQAALDSKANADAVTPIANGGTGATTKDGARKNLGIATVADVAWTDLWKDTNGYYVRWACRNNVVYVKWKIPQATTAEWKAGKIPVGYRPSMGSATVAAWTEGDRMATGWVDTYGGVGFLVSSARTNGTNQGSLSYPIFQESIMDDRALGADGYIDGTAKWVDAVKAMLENEAA